MVSQTANAASVSVTMSGGISAYDSFVCAIVVAAGSPALTRRRALYFVTR